MNRKCPKKPAKDFNLKTKKKGLDGKLWIVYKKSDGSKSWKRYEKKQKGGNNNNSNVPKKSVSFSNSINEYNYVPYNENLPNENMVNFEKLSEKKYKDEKIKHFSKWIVENILPLGETLTDELIQHVQSLCSTPGLGKGLMKGIDIYKSKLYQIPMKNVTPFLENNYNNTAEYEEHPLLTTWQNKKKEIKQLQGKKYTHNLNAQNKAKKIAMSEIKGLNASSYKEIINPPETIINMANNVDHIEYMTVHNMNIKSSIMHELNKFEINGNITVKTLYNNIYQILLEHSPNRFDKKDISNWLKRYHQNFFDNIIQNRLNKEKGELRMRNRGESNLAQLRVLRNIDDLKRFLDEEKMQKNINSFIKLTSENNSIKSTKHFEELIQEILLNRDKSVDKKIIRGMINKYYQNYIELISSRRKGST